MFTLRWGTRDTISGSTQLCNLSGTYGADFAGRMSPDVFTTLLTKTPELEKLLTQTADIHGDKTASTEEKKLHLKETAKYVGDRRKVISKTFPKDPGTKRAFGVGQPLDNDALDSVANALQSFTTAARAAPEKIAEAGILPADIDYMEQALASLKGKATVQYEKTAEAKKATVKRNELQHEIEEAMLKVVNTATLIYDKRPNVLALFKGCLPSNRARSRKQGDADSESEGAVTSESQAD